MSTLLGMMTRFTQADVVVVGLIGERGREVREFLDKSLGAEGLARSVVVATPADRSPLLRMRAAYTATAIRSEEHTSELQSLMRISYAVFCLNKKKRASHNPQQ